jgi:ABC-type transport system substrate-binding protein
LASLDPVVSTAAFVRNHGFMNYDQLFALDDKGEAQPQMVGDWSVTPDGMSYSFTLREGLAFHDGSPVKAADAVASIKRWAQRDVVGRAPATRGAPRAGRRDGVGPRGAQRLAVGHPPAREELGGRRLLDESPGVPHDKAFIRNTEANAADRTVARMELR